MTNPYPHRVSTELLEAVITTQGSEQSQELVA